MSWYVKVTYVCAGRPQYWPDPRRLYLTGASCQNGKDDDDGVDTATIELPSVIELYGDNQIHPAVVGDTQGWEFYGDRAYCPACVADAIADYAARKKP